MLHNWRDGRVTKDDTPTPATDTAIIGSGRRARSAMRATALCRLRFASKARKRKNDSAQRKRRRETPTHQRQLRSRPFLYKLRRASHPLHRQKQLRDCWWVPMATKDQGFNKAETRDHGAAKAANGRAKQASSKPARAKTNACSMRI